MPVVLPWLDRSCAMSRALWTKAGGGLPFSNVTKSSRGLKTCSVPVQATTTNDFYYLATFGMTVLTGSTSVIVKCEEHFRFYWR